MKLLPILPTLEENESFPDFEAQNELLIMTIEYFDKIGYQPPWIGYFAEKDGHLVGSAAFKGKTADNTVEVAYGVFGEFQHQGIGTEICRQLVLLGLQTDPSVRITARTLPALNYSTRILEKNNFHLLGTVIDPEDGEVWEWGYIAPNSKLR